MVEYLGYIALALAIINGIMVFILVQLLGKRLRENQKRENQNG